MFKVSFKTILFAQFLFFANPIWALDCGDWFKHLAKDHGVWVYEAQKSKPSSAFIYHKIPGSQLVVALRQNSAADWNIKIAKNRSKIEIKNNSFGYVLNLKKGKCINSSGFAKDEMSEKRQFNYDWAFCEKVLKGFSTKLKQSYNNKESVESIAARSLQSNDVRARRNFSQQRSSDLNSAYERMFQSLTATEKNKWTLLLENLKKTNDYSDVLAVNGGFRYPDILQLCRTQTQFVEQSLEGSRPSDFIPPLDLKQK
jgi:hypothetical protein